MNTIYVSGTLSSSAQIKMGDQGYLVTFTMIHSDKHKDAKGNLNEVKTPWKVTMQYDHEPLAMVKKLEEGKKVLVKGDAKINHKEVDDKFILDCNLQAQSLDLMNSSLQERLEQNKKASNRAEEVAVKSIAS